MAQYTGMILTKKGRDLQAKAEAGATLTFTKAKIGDGQLGQGQSLENLNDLISPQKTLTISSVQAESGGLCRIRTNITNQGITQGFYVREIGLFAQDPNLGEILYAISTASAADYLPPEGGATIVNNQFDIIVIVGNASSISATINPSGLVNQEQLANLQGQVDSLAKNVIGSAVVTGLAFSAAGLTASYTAGTAYVSGVKFDVAAGSIQLNANQGQYIYLDTDGKVKGTTDQAAAQTKCLLWYFTTNATNVLTSTDRRSVIDSTQFVKQTEVAANGANKIPRLDAQGKGAFSITGGAAGTQANLDTHIGAADPHTQYALKTTVQPITKVTVGPFDFNAQPGGSWIQEIKADNLSLFNQPHGFTHGAVIQTEGAHARWVQQQALCGGGGVWYRISFDHQGTTKKWGPWKPGPGVRLNKYVTARDASGNPTEIQYKSWTYPTNVLYAKVVFTNPDANGKYQTATVTYYYADGATIQDQPETYAIGYTTDGAFNSLV